MAWVYSPDGKAHEVPDEEVATRILDGRARLKKGQRINVQSPEGEFGSIDAADAFNAFKAGWQYDTDTARERRRLEAEYGGIGGQAIAGLEGVGAGLTLGASRPIEKALGVGAEGIQARREIFPATSLGGELAGAVGGTVLAGLATEGPGAIPAAGRVAALAPAAKAAMFGTAVTKKLGGGLLAKAAGAGTEAALYGGASQLSEDILGDEKITAEKTLAAAGLSGLLGGGTAGTFHLAGALTRRAQARMAGALAPDASWAPQGSLAAAEEALISRAEADPSTLGGKVVEALIGKDAKAAAARGMRDRSYRSLMRTAESDANLRWIEGADAMQGFVGQVNDTLDTLRNTIKPAEIDAGLALVDAANARMKAFELSEEMRQLVMRMKASPADFHRSSRAARIFDQAKKIEQKLGVKKQWIPGTDPKRYTRVLDPKKAPTAREVWDVLDDVKRNFDDIAALGMATPATERPAANAAAGLRKRLKVFLEDDKVWGGSAVAQQKRNDLISEVIAATDNYLESPDFGARAGWKGGKLQWRIDPGKEATFYQNLGKPGNELKKEAFVQMMRTAKRLSDEVAGDKKLKEVLASTFGKTEELSRLARAMADARKIGGVAGAAENALGSMVGRAALGSIVGGPAGAVLGVAAPWVGKTAIHVFDQVILKNKAQIGLLAKRIATSSKPIRDRAPMAAALVFNNARFTEQRSTRKPKDIREAYHRTVSELQTLAENPDIAIAQIRRTLGPIRTESPRSAQALETDALRLLALAISKVPPGPEPPMLGGPLTKVSPSTTEIINTAEALKAINDPLAVMDDVAHGRVSTIAAATLREAYPAQFQEMQTAILEAIAESGQAVPYQTRVQLSVFFGEPLDPSLQPDRIVAHQATYAAEGPEEGGGEKTLKSTKTLKSIAGAMSATERIEAKELGKLA